MAVRFDTFHLNSITFGIDLSTTVCTRWTFDLEMMSAPLGKENKGSPL